MPVRAHLRLGAILLKEGLVNENQIQEAVRYQKTSGRRLGESLVDLRMVTEEQIAEILGRQLGIPYKRFAQGELQPGSDPSLRSVFPLEMIRKEAILPISRSITGLTVAMADPLDLILIDNLKKMAGAQIIPIIATRSDLQSAIEAAYGKLDLLKEAVAGSYQSSAQSITSVEEPTELSSAQAIEDVAAQAGQAQVIRLVDLFLLEAVNSRASDIHIEPYMSRLSIRFRIDGVLQPVDPPSPRLMPAIISRIKILARMDISEKRLPQDGGFTIKIGERTVDLRVSSIPVIYGEKIVIRLLDKSNLVTDYAALGLEGQALSDVEKGITSPYGLIFITGPTGSGKSTTLYATLLKLRSPGKNLLTIEDPVEYKVDGINQVQAKPQIGLTFAAGLRAFLRQDPDIIMVGEVRDLETSEICVRAALTGHLVLSTLHTNDSASAITRLTDLGIEPVLLAPSLVLIIAQRLVRTLCTDCREPTDPPPMSSNIVLPPGQYYRAKGCPKCRQVGYRGRNALYEVLSADGDIRHLINQRSNAEQIKQAAREKGMKTLFESGLLKAAAGLTSIEEVLSVTRVDV
ncbi:MAG: Flp pilus assembly complex ATPase component TadA [Candidatus Omnitrophica bacterium]|nr:Flp pilus assembly complex ATPase component TadA [Candidatus Omnitrophota bacterium]